MKEMKMNNTNNSLTISTVIVALSLFGFVLNLPMKIEELNNANQENFVSRLGQIFENSPWVAQAAYAERPFRGVDQLFNAMQNVLMNAGREKQLELIRAHPELAGKDMLGGNLSKYSTSEQANAGLDAMTAQQLAEFNALNSAYKSRFNFPFILALRDQREGGISAILAEFRRRIRNTEAQEINEALVQIGRIARHRLETLLEQK